MRCHSFGESPFTYILLVVAQLLPLVSDQARDVWEDEFYSKRKLGLEEGTYLDAPLSGGVFCGCCRAYRRREVSSLRCLLSQRSSSSFSLIFHPLRLVWQLKLTGWPGLQPELAATPS